MDQLLHLVPHRSLANQNDLEVEPLGGEQGRGLDQQQVPLLLGDPRDADEPRVRGDRRSGRAQQVLVDAAPDHLDLWPVLGPCPAVELASAEATDGDDEGGTLDLLAQAEELGFVELLGPMHREAEGRPPELAAEHRDHRRVGPEVGVDVVGSRSLQPAGQHAAFGQVGEVSQQTAVRTPSEPDRENQGAQGCRRPAHRASEHRECVPGGSGPEHHTRPAPLQPVCLVHQLLPQRLDAEAQHLDALRFQGVDLAPDEAVAGRRILVDEISDPQLISPDSENPRTSTLWRKKSRSSIGGARLVEPRTRERRSHTRCPESQARSASRAYSGPRFFTK